MGLREIKDKVEAEHPDWTKRQQLEEIDRLRKAERAAKKTTAAAEGAPADDKPQPASVAEAWGFLAAVVIGLRLIAWAAWGGPFDGPHWYDALYVGLLIVGIVAVAGAYRRRS